MDVVALGNMCVDILLPPAPIPTPETLKTEATLAELTAASPPQALWEVGGKERKGGDGAVGRFTAHAPSVRASSHAASPAAPVFLRSSPGGLPNAPEGHRGHHHHHHVLSSKKTRVFSNIRT